LSLPGPPLPATEPRLPPNWQLRAFELLLAARLLRSRRSAHLSLVTAMSVAGIALGVAALIVVLAVNTGFQTAFADRILATYPHLVIMQRGVDLRDHRGVAAKLETVPGVRQVSPATYDDMMLSSQDGRGGAIVRGVPVEVLRQLPPGAIVAGQIDGRGELPLLDVSQPGLLRVTAGIAGGRHIAWLPPTNSAKARPLQLIAVQGAAHGLGAVQVFDAAGCEATPAGRRQLATPPGTLAVLTSRTGDPLRQGERGLCRIAASFELLPGILYLRWLDGGVQRELEFEVVAGQTTTILLDGAEATAVAGPPADLPALVAAVRPVVAQGQTLQVVLPEAQPQPLPADPTAAWLALPAELPAVALGEGLAKRLQVKIGDEVRAVSPTRGIDRGGEVGAESASGRFRVATIIRTGFHDHDQRLALVDFSAAQRFLGRGDLARWVEVRVADPILASQQVEQFRAALEPTDLAELLAQTQQLKSRLADLPKTAQAGTELRPADDAVALVDNWVTGLRVARQVRGRTTSQYRVMDWEEMNRNIFDAARMQKVAMSLFPFIIVLVAALNVVGTQAVIVHERARDIAILRAMGSTRRSVASVFLLQGLVVGLLGTALGLGLGGLACVLLDVVGYPLDPQVYLIDRVPVQIEAAMFVLAGGAAVVLAFGAAWLAAQRAAARRPVDALRRLD
jgi:ABC-type lipoprotein release transport system permease subunit